jgi:hypothetical protein
MNLLIRRSSLQRERERERERETMEWRRRNREAEEEVAGRMEGRKKLAGW